MLQTCPTCGQPWQQTGQKAPPPIKAPYAYAIDVTGNRPLYGKAENTVVPEGKVWTASMAKMMTVRVAYDRSKLSTMVTMLAEDVDAGGSAYGLKAGDKLTWDDLFYLTGMRSANECADAAARIVGGSIKGFTAMMNAEAAKLGMTKTKFTGPNGYTQRYYPTTAVDMATLANAVLRDPNLRPYFGTAERTIKVNGKAIDLTANSILLTEAEFERVIATKGGSVNRAYSTGILWRAPAGQEVVITILVSPGKEALQADYRAILKRLPVDFPYLA